MRKLGLLASISMLSVVSLNSSVAQVPNGSRSVAGTQSSANIHLVAHIPLRATDIDIEQELSRPYAYASSGRDGGFHIIDLKDPAKARVIYSWQINDVELHQGGGALGPIYLKSKGRYYFVQSYQYLRAGPDRDLGAIVFDVTGLPDTSKIRELKRIRTPEAPGGFHEDFGYKHSDGRALYLATTVSPHAYVYDIDQVVGSGPNEGVVGKVPIPDGANQGVDPNLAAVQPSYHDFYVGYDPAHKQDRFYGAGSGGYYVYDITNLAEPKLLTSVTGVAGVSWGHTFTPDPTGRYAVTEAEYTYAPLRLFDLKPGLDGQVKTISRPVSAWTASWKGLPHNHEVRWPYVFVSTYADEFYVFNMMDPTNPYTVGYYDTAPGVDLSGGSTFGVDVRNADGLIVTSDYRIGFFAFRMDGFDGWNGHQWGLPNISSAQDWDNGPDGAPKPAKVS